MQNCVVNTAYILSKWLHRQCVILLTFLLPFISIYHLFQDTECKLLTMCKGEVSISDSLLHPPFSNEVVK